MRKKLEDNKDKEVSEQTDHIQAKTIKLKLQSVIRFTRDPHNVIGLNRQDMNDLTEFIGTLRKNLKWIGITNQQAEMITST